MDGWLGYKPSSGMVGESWWIKRDFIEHIEARKRWYVDTCWFILVKHLDSQSGLIGTWDLELIWYWNTNGLRAARSHQRLTSMLFSSAGRVWWNCDGSMAKEKVNGEGQSGSHFGLKGIKVFALRQVRGDGNGGLGGLRKSRKYNFGRWVVYAGWAGSC